MSAVKTNISTYSNHTLVLSSWDTNNKTDDVYLDISSLQPDPRDLLPLELMKGEAIVLYESRWSMDFIEYQFPLVIYFKEHSFKNIRDTF